METQEAQGMKKKSLPGQGKHKSLFLVGMVGIALVLMGALCQVGSPGTLPKLGGAFDGSSTIISQLNFTQLKMLDPTTGWAINQGQILKTTDGGKTWDDLTPTDWEPLDTQDTPTPATAPPTPPSIVTADFLDANHAWIVASTELSQDEADAQVTALGTATTEHNGTVTVDANKLPPVDTTILVRSTLDGGKTWVTSSAIAVVNLIGISTPTMITVHEGWLEAITTNPKTKSELGSFYHTVDGGMTWTLQSPPLSVKNEAQLNGMTITPLCEEPGNTGPLPPCPPAPPSQTLGCTVSGTLQYAGWATGEAVGWRDLVLAQQMGVAGWTLLPDGVPKGTPQQKKDSMVVTNPPILFADGKGILPVQIQSDPDGDDPSHYFLHLYQVQVLPSDGEDFISSLGPTSSFAVSVSAALHPVSALDSTHIFTIGQSYSKGTYGNWNLYEFNGKQWNPLTSQIDATIPAPDAGDQPDFFGPALDNLDFLSPTQGWATNGGNFYHIAIANGVATWSQVYPAATTTPPANPATPSLQIITPPRTPGAVIAAPQNPGPCQTQNTKLTLNNQKILFAPYTEETTNLTQVLKDTGANALNLAFSASTGGCQPGLDTGEAAAIQAMPANSAIVSFGGADADDNHSSQKELGMVCDSVSALENAYQEVIDTYKVSRLDFDIEGDAADNSSSIDLRNQAIAALEVKNPNLQISYTLSAGPGGLDDTGVSLLHDAVSRNANVNIVNFMAFDDGSSASYPGDQMGQNEINVANTVEAQLKQIYPNKTDAQLYAMIGIVSMLGVDDNGSETFTLSDAQQVLAFAEQKGLGELSFWVTERDHPCNGGAKASNDQCSGIAQGDYAFSKILSTFK